jgi:hypothetical protein
MHPRAAFRAAPVIRSISGADLPVERDHEPVRALRLGTPRSVPVGAKGSTAPTGQRERAGRPNVTAMGAPLSHRPAPVVFDASVQALQAALGLVRADVAVHELPAPTRIAPHAFSLAGTVGRDGDDVASGRLVLLFDPDGQNAWEGTTRFVCYARAEVDPEVAADPLVSEVTWSWLCEALHAHDVDVRALGGTVTTTASRRFGVLAADGDNFDVELRCSWSPAWAETTRGGRQPWSRSAAVAQLSAFVDVLAAMAGIPPQPNGVVPLDARRSGSG